MAVCTSGCIAFGNLFCCHVNRSLPDCRKAFWNSSKKNSECYKSNRVLN